MSGNQEGRQMAEKAKIICPPLTGGHNSRWPPKVVEKLVFGHVTSLIG